MRVGFSIMSRRCAGDRARGRRGRARLVSEALAVEVGRGEADTPGRGREATAGDRAIVRELENQREWVRWLRDLQ